MRSEATGWESHPLPDVIDFQEGPGILAKDFRDSGTPLVRLAGLSGGSLLAGCNYLDPEMVAKRWAHFALREGDTLLSTSASLGRTARVTPDAEGAIAYTGLIRMRPRDERVRSEYVRRLLQDPRFQQQVEAMGAGSVMRHFGPSHLRQMTVVLPPRDDQKRIDSVLSALEAKMASNDRLASLLEQTITALYRARFVGFVGAPSLVGSELGPIPEGWEVGPIGDQARIMGGGTPSTKMPEYWEDGDHAWATPKDLAGLTFLPLIDTGRRLTEQGLSKVSSGLLPPGAVLLSSRAPIGYVAITEIPTAINQGFIALVCDGRLPNHYVAQWLIANMARITAAANGTTFLEVSKANFRPLLALLPPPPVAAEFQQVADPLYRRVVGSVRENVLLAQLRDALLPKLVSGKIRVGDAEAVVEAA